MAKLEFDKNTPKSKILESIKAELDAMIPDDPDHPNHALRASNSGQVAWYGKTPWGGIYSKSSSYSKQQFAKAA